MGHAGHQLADCGHLLGLDDLRLERALLGDVLHQGDDCPGAEGPAQRRQGDAEQALVVVARQRQRGGALAGPRLAHGVAKGDGTGQHQVNEVTADERGRLIA